MGELNMTEPDDFVSATVSAFGTTKSITTAEDMTSSTTLPTFTNITQVVTTAVTSDTDATVTAVVIVLILLTLVILGFLLYRYMCHNKGAYRTTGELAPGEDPDEDHHGQPLSEKTEYFI